MTISVLTMILAFTLGSATGQLNEGSPSPAQTNDLVPESHCVINGRVVNPCEMDEPPPSDPSGNELQT